MKKLANYLKNAHKKYFIWEEHRGSLGIVHRFLDDNNKFNTAVRIGPSFDTAKEAIEYFHQNVNDIKAKNENLGKVYIRNTIGNDKQLM